jgi:hypothetical protein
MQLYSFGGKMKKANRILIVVLFIILVPILTTACALYELGSDMARPDPGQTSEPAPAPAPDPTPAPTPAPTPEPISLVTDDPIIGTWLWDMALGYLSEDNSIVFFDDLSGVEVMFGNRRGFTWTVENNDTLTIIYDDDVDIIVREQTFKYMIIGDEMLKVPDNFDITLHYYRAGSDSAASFGQTGGTDGNNVFVGTLEGDGFRISVLDGWSELMMGGSYSRHGSAGLLSLDTRHGIGDDLHMFAIAYASVLNDNAYEFDLKDFRNMDIGQYDGVFLNFYLKSTEDADTVEVFNYIVLENDTAYLVRFISMGDFTPNNIIEEVEIMASSMVIG